MKTKGFLLCLLFLMLGTTTVFADKYYKPSTYKSGTNPRKTLAEYANTGKKFMIYNTAINGNVDHTGFLRNNGTNFVCDKTKERDNLIYNESFVYTMEGFDTDSDGKFDYYAIKSVQTGLYVNINGETDCLKADDAKLYITSWDEAVADNDIAQSDVNMENWQFNIVANNNIVSGGHGSTVFVVKNGNTYWNGKVTEFYKYTNGHPYAFYEVNEVTSGDYLQDLHIYSRSDIYSAQVIYGYIQNPSQITSSPVNDATTYPNGYTAEGGFENLLDGDVATYNVTDLQNHTEGHYYQIDLGESVSSLYLYMHRRADGKYAPKKFELQACATANGVFTTIDEYTTDLANSATYTSPLINLNGSYQYIRIVAKELTTDGYSCMGLAELSVLPGTNEVADAFEYFNEVNSVKCPIYTKASAQVYAQTIEDYNNRFPDARLLSGVPIPGNKYRIYADAYDIDSKAHVNKEIMVGNTGLSIQPYGSYNGASEAEKSKYEWYCEQTTDGYLVFKNVADPTKYLGYGTVTDTPYKWSINTVLTQRFGVPLMNDAMQYLAMINNGSGWQGDVKSVHDQTQPYSFETVDDKGDDDASNDETVTISIDAGICTDFVFIPVPLIDGVEKRITIKANQLVERNTQLLYDSDGDGNKETYSMPFSRMFVKTGDNNPALPELHLLCKSIHGYKGIMVDGVAANAKATLNGTVLSFNFDEINSGDVLDVQFEIAEPFVYSNPDMSDDVNKPTLYVIKNLRPQGVQQQARPNRAANIEIGGDEGDGPISSQTGVVFYAKFEERNSNMRLVQRDAAFDATSLFYFTETEDDDRTEYYSTRIHNVTTVMKCASDVSWNANGNTWYVQPKNTASYTGYNIGITALNANNNPDDVWCSNHADGDKILRYKANDDGAAWMFEKVEDAEAKELLKKYIEKIAGVLTTELDNITQDEITEKGYDAVKIGKYKTMVGQFETFAEDYYDADSIAKLVQLAQNIHMLEHEIDYALYELPLLSDETKMDKANGFANPHWYYIKNVKSDNRYATYNGDNNTLSLAQIQPALNNLFYFVGSKNTYAADGYVDFPGNNLIIDEYLKAHIHNFMSKGYTFVSKNVELMNRDDLNPGQGKQTVVDSLNLKSNESWSIELEYDLSGTSFNAYGSCLLAGSDDPLKDNYANEFQVYFKDDRSIVIKVNNGNDTYRFWHTQSNFSHIKVVITYSQQKVTLDVYNSLNEKESKTITGVTLDDVTELTSALPAEGAKLTRLATYKVEAMTWKEHSTDGKDLWYILPSSNVEKKGFAIVLDEPNDTKMGWTNGEGNNTYVASDLGTHDNSTWKFERVVNFDAHLNELLAMYNLDDVVIYNKELVELYYIIEKSKTIIYDDTKNGTAEEEAAFNEVYDAILNYTGPMPEELRAPKSGKFYTIHPASDVEEVEMSVHVDKAADEISTNEVNRITKIVTYSGGQDGHDEYNSRGVWYFEGTADGDGFLPLEGLNFRNLHTQTQLNAFGADGALLTEEGALGVTLAKIGGAKVAIQAGGSNMARGDVASKSIINAAADRTFASDHATVTFNWGELSAHVDVNTGEITTEYFNSNMVATDKGNVSFTTSHSILTGNSIAEPVLCSNVNGNTSPEIVHTFTFSDLGGSFTFNHIALDIHAFNGARKYQMNNDSVDRQWNVKAQVGNGDGNFTDFFTLTDIDIAAGVGEDDNVHQKWGLAGNEFTTTTGTLVLKLTITKGTNNKGCFFGLSEVALSNVGDVWYIEEIADPTKIYHSVTTTSAGHATLMLGFPALIPAEVEAFRGVQHGPVGNSQYISMLSYGEPGETRILPAETPVVVRNYPESAEAKTVKFYYRESDEKRIEDEYFRGSLYYKVLNAREYDDPFTAEVETGDVNIYMLQTNRGTSKMYWIYEEAEADGTVKPENDNTDNGGYVVCNANKAYMILPAASTSSSSFSLRFANGGATDVEEVFENENTDGTELVETIYDLQGRRLSEIKTPGIYIINGKKVLVK